MASIEALFDAIKAGDANKVRDFLLQDKGLTSQKHRDPTVKFDAELEMDAYKFLGAYIGQVTPLQLAILCGQDSIAKDILERTLQDDLDIPFGGGNTALHLATLLGVRDIVKALLERGANWKAANAKGLTPLDIVDNADMRTLFTESE
ncbi:hypothetical protein BC832DRAFT_548205 [Gaertneriomyces semiglobifer]|nr:hypothetical protein BC832DRAFT_548205 [Gaertneriomyces semiglobifer]